jgi:hypothetical protein
VGGLFLVQCFDALLKKRAVQLMIKVGAHGCDPFAVVWSD